MNFYIQSRYYSLQITFRCGKKKNDKRALQVKKMSTILFLDFLAIDKCFKTIFYMASIH